jgi:hypothetical protein
VKRWLLLVVVACHSPAPPPAAAPVSNTAPVSAGPPPLNQEQACGALFDHIVELELGKTHAGKADRKLREMFANKRAEFVSTCVAKTPRDRVDCALAAKDVDAITACDGAPLE